MTPIEMELALLREMVTAVEGYNLYVDLSEPWACEHCGPAAPDAFLCAQQVLSNALLSYREWKREKAEGSS